MEFYIGIYWTITATYRKCTAEIVCCAKLELLCRYLVERTIKVDVLKSRNWICACAQYSNSIQIFLFHVKISNDMFIWFISIQDLLVWKYKSRFFLKTKTYKSLINSLSVNYLIIIYNSLLIISPNSINILSMPLRRRIFTHMFNISWTLGQEIMTGLLKNIKYICRWWCHPWARLCFSSNTKLAY